MAQALRVVRRLGFMLDTSFERLDGSVWVPVTSRMATPGRRRKTSLTLPHVRDALRDSVILGVRSCQHRQGRMTRQDARETHEVMVLTAKMSTMPTCHVCIVRQVGMSCRYVMCALYVKSVMYVCKYIMYG